MRACSCVPSSHLFNLSFFHLAVTAILACDRSRMGAMTKSYEARELDEDVHGRTAGVFERVANRIASDGSLVGFGTFEGHLSINFYTCFK